MDLYWSPWWAGVAVALTLAFGAGVADWRRHRRANLDAVGLLDWRTVQMLGLIAAAMCAMMALMK